MKKIIDVLDDTCNTVDKNISQKKHYWLVCSIKAKEIGVIIKQKPMKFKQKDDTLYTQEVIC